MSKPNPLLGVVVGVVAGWVATTAVSYAGTRLAVTRAVRLETDLVKSLPWLALLLAVAVVVGLLVAVRPIGAGVLVGAGALMGVVGLATQLLPPRTAFDLMELFKVPGSRPLPGYLFFDGSLIFVGVLLLIAGIARWVSDTRRPQQLQDTPNRYGGYPGQPQQQAGPWPTQPYQGQPGQPPHGPGQQQRPY
ncbi:hypothetical protein FB561_0268 [Kribbella amoyensis]|uniref:Uncharacterized protein n=1 Tax=Kribbella amoyensis TaxID=996641 RepID=A0A561BK46_9ACTN|nr:hypothetical protein [Kribbella amoyensis]TWD79213.1 hypothetical protein FB561_0268 [Kribbella amoyensis]